VSSTNLVEQTKRDPSVGDQCRSTFSHFSLAPKRWVDIVFVVFLVSHLAYLQSDVFMQVRWIPAEAATDSVSIYRSENDMFEIDTNRISPCDTNYELKTELTILNARDTTRREVLTNFDFGDGIRNDLES